MFEFKRFVRDIGRKAIEVDPQPQEYLERAEKLLDQTRKSKNKLYSIYAPEVECISKGKAHKALHFCSGVYTNSSPIFFKQ